MQYSQEKPRIRGNIILELQYLKTEEGGGREAQEEHPSGEFQMSIIEDN
jgi:hypothetical protein